MSRPGRVSASRKLKARASMPTDAWVGSRIRMRRHTISMSQGTLGAALGVTFQQVQKYENGVNRVGAGRLELIARVLGMPIAWFFDDAPKLAKVSAQSTEPMSDLAAFLRSRYAPKIVRGFVRLPEPLQKNLTRLISQVAAGRG